MGSKVGNTAKPVRAAEPQRINLRETEIFLSFKTSSSTFTGLQKHPVHHLKTNKMGKSNFVDFPIHAACSVAVRRLM